MFRQLEQEVANLRNQQNNSEFRLQQALNVENERRERITTQDENLLGMQIATVVDTQDPLKQGRVRFYTPYLDLNTTSIEGLPWASPVSPFGGFDDSGCLWVPPAGSKIAVFFLHGSRDAAFYVGSIWYRNRGTINNHLEYWDYPVSEYACLWEGRRNGYLVGSNAGDQVLPPWNNETYHSYDTDSVNDFYQDPSQYSAFTYPYVKGFKTEQKHMLKFVEGDPRCNRRWNRVELASGRGNFLVFKDDHLHPSGQWAFGGINGDTTFCHQTKTSPDDSNLVFEIPKEFPCCAGDEAGFLKPCTPPTCFAKQCPIQDETSPTVDRKTRFANPFYKRYEEMRPHWGANTPLSNRMQLDQSGAQLQSLSGHQLIMDDSVNQPTGVPSWDLDFDFGCDDTFRGGLWLRSATGHVIRMSDVEEIGSSKIRGPNNGISMQTATGNFFEMNDHTVTDVPCRAQFAGERRGITMMSSSTHLFQMNDSHLNQFTSPRLDDGFPEKSTEDGFEGYVLLRSGYGLQLLMKDGTRQDSTNTQFMQLLAPQTNNVERGPHMMVMQEEASGPGLVMMRAGGVYYQGSYDESIEVVGTEEHQSSKFSTITDNYFIDVKHVYFNRNQTTMYWSDDYIFLMAGKDCSVLSPEEEAEQSQQAQDSDISNAQSSPGSNNGQSCTPCSYNVIVSKDPWACPFTGYVHYGVKAGEDGIELDSRSTRVYASSGQPGGKKCTID